MKKFNGYLRWGVILSQLSHIFCCGLPAVVALLSLLSGAGLMSALPGALSHSHEIFHAWETSIFIFSAIVLAIGWGLDIAARKVDCHDTGCGHPPCEPVKQRAHFTLKIATVLFLANLFILLFAHS